VTAGEPIAVVGLAGLFPAAPDATTFWSNIVDGRDAITDVPAGRWDPEYFDPSHAGAERFYCRRGGFVDDIATFDPASFGIMPVAVDHADPDQLLALRVAAAAVDDAGGPAGLIDDPRKVGVILGRGGYYNAGVVRLDQRVRVAEQVCTTLREVVPGISEDDLFHVRQAFRQELGPEHPEAMIGLVPNLTASRIANRLNLQGPAYTVDAACASSLVAVDQAIHELRSRRCDIVLAGGSHHCHDVTFWSVFTQLGALSPTGTIRPFDRKADGMLIGEGTGVVVLQRLADAERAGRRVYAVICGSGVASDGRDTSLMRPKMAGQLLALQRAWQDADLDPTTIGLLEAHGTATQVGDRTEIDTMAEFFGVPEEGNGDLGDPNRAGVGSVKSMIGHAMPAAGIAGLIKVVLALHNQVLPPTINCDEPSRALAATRFRTLVEAEPWEAGSHPRRAAVNAFGFGGTNAHVVLQEAPGTGGSGQTRRPGRRWCVATSSGAVPSVPPGDRVLLLAGDTVDDILGQLGTAADDDVLTARDDWGRVPAGPVRLALVGATPKRLAVARRVVAQGMPWRGRNDLWFSTSGLLDPEAGGGTLAFLFPGVEPEFAPLVDDVAQFLGIAPPDIEQVGMIGFQAQAIVSVGRMVDRALASCGVRPDAVAGHSIGEMTAGLVAQLAPEREYDALVESVDVARVALPDTLFAALSCGVAEAEEAIAGVPGVVVSHDNCPHQSIICGEESAVRSVLGRLRTRRVMSVELPFRSGFHSPMFEPYLDPIRALLDPLPVLERKIPIWSATLADLYPSDEAGVRSVAIRHLVEPVRFREMVQAMWAQGIRGFVQVGTGSLTGFVEDTLHGMDMLCVDAASAKRQGIDQLRRVLAALWVEGRPGVDPGVLAPGVPAGTADAVAGAGGAAGAPTIVRSSGGRLLRLGAPLVHLGDRVCLGDGGMPARDGGTERRSIDTGVSGSGASGSDGELQRRPGGVVPGGVATAGTLRAPTGLGPNVSVPVGAGAFTGAVTSRALIELQGLLDDVVEAGAAVIEAHQHARRRPDPVRRFGAGPPAGTPQSPCGGDPIALPRPTVPPTKAQPTDTGRPERLQAVVPLVGQPTVPLVGQPTVPLVGQPTVPLVGQGNSDGRSLRRLPVSLQTMPWLVDHAFFHMPPQWPDPADRFPVVPMTTTMQLVTEEAQALVPGTVAVGMRAMRALRWIAAVPPIDVTVRATRTAPDEVRVALDGYAKATVLLADRYPTPPMVDTTPLRNEHPSPYDATEVYSDRWLFHGPRYQSVIEVGPVGDDGLRGRLRCGEAPGSLLDGAGQLVGYWVDITQDHNQLALPSTVADVGFYGPHPSVGAELVCVVRIRQLYEDRVVADVDLAHDDGSVWCRLTGWEERRFVTDGHVFDAFRYPENHTIAERQAGGWYLATERWADAATRELLVRNYTTRAERAEYDRLNPRQQRHWALGRVAAKDVVRQKVLEHGGPGLYPVEVRIGHLASGAPTVEMDEPMGADFTVSIAHTDWIGVAIVGEGRPVGIDIEPVAGRSARFEELITGPTERALVAAGDGVRRDEVLTRLWCVKEAVAKASGTGLQGKPRAFAVEEVDGESYRIGGQWVATTVVTMKEGAFVVAWTIDR